MASGDAVVVLRQGTYYGDVGASGTCSFDLSDAQLLPWASGTQLRVAMDQPLFFNSQTCGMCLAMHATGPGSGGATHQHLAATLHQPSWLVPVDTMTPAQH